MDIHRLALLFDYEPVATSFLLFIITITAVAFVVLACLGTFSLWGRLRKKRPVSSQQGAAA